MFVNDGASHNPSLANENVACQLSCLLSLRHHYLPGRRRGVPFIFINSRSIDLKG